MADVRKTISRLSEQRKLGRLCSLASAISMKYQSISVVRRCRAGCLPFDEQRWPASLTQEDCKKRFVQMNDDPDVIGVILQRPVPDHINVRSFSLQFIRWATLRDESGVDWQHRL